MKVFRLVMRTLRSRRSSIVHKCQRASEKGPVSVSVGPISRRVFARCNWVSNSRSMCLPLSNTVVSLGEINGSFAYTSAGQKLSKTNDESTDDTYGESFGPSDVIGSFIDFGDDDDRSIRISFSKNGVDLGRAFEFPRADSHEFYPHVLAKNVKFECNFGQLVSIERRCRHSLMSVRRRIPGSQSHRSTHSRRTFRSQIASVAPSPSRKRVNVKLFCSRA